MGDHACRASSHVVFDPSLSSIMGYSSDCVRLQIVQIEEALRERFFGEFEGKSHDNYPLVWGEDEKDISYRPDGEHQALMLRRLAHNLKQRIPHDRRPKMSFAHLMQEGARACRMWLTGWNPSCVPWTPSMLGRMSSWWHTVTPCQSFGQYTITRLSSDTGM